MDLKISAKELFDVAELIIGGFKIQGASKTYMFMGFPGIPWNSKWDG